MDDDQKAAWAAFIKANAAFFGVEPDQVQDLINLTPAPETDASREMQTLAADLKPEWQKQERIDAARAGAKLLVDWVRKALSSEMQLTKDGVAVLARSDLAAFVGRHVLARQRGGEEPEDEAKEDEAELAAARATMDAWRDADEAARKLRDALAPLLGNNSPLPAPEAILAALDVNRGLGSGKPKRGPSGHEWIGVACDWECEVRRLLRAVGCPEKRANSNDDDAPIWPVLAQLVAFRFPNVRGKHGGSIAHKTIIRAMRGKSAPRSSRKPQHS